MSGLFVFRWMGMCVLLSPVWGKLPCEYLQMQDGNLVVQPGTTMCLGKCPADISAAGKNIYVSADQKLQFNNFVLSTSLTGFTVATNEGVNIMSCTNAQCFSGYIPDPLPTAPGFYLTGRPGGVTLSAFDPWLPLSTIQLDETSTLSQVELQGSAAFSGWRIVNNNYSYTFTSKQQLIVGDVPISTILDAPNAAVIAEGPVTVRKGVHACPQTQIMHSTLASVLVVYMSESTTGDGALTASTTYTATFIQNQCTPNPFATDVGSSPQLFLKFDLAYPSTGNFYADNQCQRKISKIPLVGSFDQIHYGVKGWYALYLGG